MPLIACDCSHAVPPRSSFLCMLWVLWDCHFFSHCGDDVWLSTFSPDESTSTVVCSMCRSCTRNSLDTRRFLLGGLITRLSWFVNPPAYNLSQDSTMHSMRAAKRARYGSRDDRVMGRSGRDRDRHRLTHKTAWWLAGSLGSYRGGARLFHQQGRAQAGVSSPELSSCLSSQKLIAIPFTRGIIHP